MKNNIKIHMTSCVRSFPQSKIALAVKQGITDNYPMKTRRVVRTDVAMAHRQLRNVSGKKEKRVNGRRTRRHAKLEAMREAEESDSRNTGRVL